MQPQYAQGDGLGSVRLITDANGNAAGTAGYEAWGTPQTGSASLGGFGFTGEQQDAETGFVYLRARHYDPTTGRFLQQDSYPGIPSQPQGQHRFAYAHGNPIRYTDPSGHNVFDPGMSGDFGYGPPIAGAAGALAIGAWLQQNKQQVDQFWQTTTNSVGQWWQQLCSVGREQGNQRKPYVMGPNDVDWRGTGKTYQQALDEAFEKAGIPKGTLPDEWAPGPYGKEVPVQWHGPGGAEVSVDYPHDREGPDAPHIGWQSAGNDRSNGKGARGHIVIDDVPGGRSKDK
jgi:RHS repeat-associated protein